MSRDYLKEFVLNSITNYKSFCKKADKDGQPGVSRKEFIESFIPMKIQDSENPNVTIVFGEDRIQELEKIYNQIDSNQDNNATEKEFFQGLKNFKGDNKESWFFQEQAKEYGIIPLEQTLRYDIGTPETGYLNISRINPVKRFQPNHIAYTVDNFKYEHLEFNPKGNSIKIKNLSDKNLIYSKKPPEKLIFENLNSQKFKIVNDQKFSLAINNCDNLLLDTFAKENINVEINGGSNNSINFNSADLSVDPCLEKKYTILINDSKTGNKYYTDINQGSDDITYNQNVEDAEYNIINNCDENGNYDMSKIKKAELDQFTIGRGDKFKLPGEAYSFLLNNKGGEIYNSEGKEVTLSLPESEIKGLGCFKDIYYSLYYDFSIPEGNYLVSGENNNINIIDLETGMTVAYVNKKPEVPVVKEIKTPVEDDNIPEIKSKDELEAKYREWLENFKNKKDLYETDVIVHNTSFFNKTDETTYKEIFNLLKNDYPKYCRLLNDPEYRKETYYSEYSKRFNSDEGADYESPDKRKQDIEDFWKNPENLKKSKLYNYFTFMEVQVGEGLSEDTYKSIYEQSVKEGFSMPDFKTFVAYNLYMKEEAKVSQNLDELSKEGFADSGYQYLPSKMPIFIPKLKKQN